MSHHQSSQIFGMKPVNIFRWIDGNGDGKFIDLFWEWLLHQNAVDCRVVVQLLDGLEQMFLGSVGRHFDDGGNHADLFACFGFIAYINLRCGILADNDNCQSGYFAGLGPVAVNALLEFVFQVKRDLFSVDNEHGGVAL